MTKPALRGHADPFAQFRDAFAIPDGVIYLDGNSLGPLPKAAQARMRKAVEQEWGDSLIRGWNAHDWIGLPGKVGDKIARLIGAQAGSLVAGDSTSVNLFKALSAALALRPERGVILSDEGNFPTDLYIAQGLTGMLGRGALRAVPRESIADAITEDVAAVMLTQVDYRSGHRFALEEITARAHAAGAVMIWDFAHSAGAFPVDVGASGAEFAVGCGYKYLNGGPGAPGFIYVRPDLADSVQPALSGWMGHAAPFAFDPDYRPARGVARMQAGTPPVLGLSALDAALEMFEDVDLAALWEKSAVLTDIFLRGLETPISTGALRPAGPTDPARRGSQLSFHCENGYAVMQALIAEGVIGDFRAPDIIRFGFAPLYLSLDEVARAAALLCDILASGRWDKPEFHQKAKVT